MTVSYSPDSFFDMIFKKWTGSLLKMVWKMLLFYLVLYYALYITYKCLDEEQQFTFRAVIKYVRGCQKYYDLTFLLGFFVMLIVNRWWAQSIIVIIGCKPDKVVRTIASIVGQPTEESRLIRRTFARWCIAIQALSWRSVSSRVLRRIPTEGHLVQMGLLTEKELGMLMAVENVSGYDRYMIPILWSFNLLNHLKRQKIIDSWQATNAKEFLEEYYDSYKRMWIYSFLSVPLTYTQVAYLATQAFFVVNIFSSQPILEGDPDTYVPFFMLLQFFFYMGWLQVAEALIDPYGEDDDDYEMNYLLDTNLRNALFIADQIDEVSPEDLVPGILNDKTLDIKWPRILAHTKASSEIDEIIPLGNEEILAFKPTQADMEMPEQSIDFLRQRVLEKAEKIVAEE